MKEIYTLIVIINIIIKPSLQNILGCGGFVKSHVPIDFSKVEVKLLTKQGIFKDKINCAPTNGYYFVPLYDKGEYVLELEPPPGWSFTPTKVDLVVDGATDLCSQGKDIDFTFTGFGITGKVESLGNKNGPAGIQVELKSSSETRHTTTGPNGDFFFTPVYPGQYIVKISNSKWKIWKDSVNVVVTEGNTELSPGSLIIQGYDVSGSVRDENEPIRDVTIVLYGQEKSHSKSYGCDETPLPGIKSDKKPICHVKTNEQGIFTFGAVPYGKYFIMPYYTEENIYYQPNLIKFEVRHGSVILEENFEIIGFNILGRILKSPNGDPIDKAKIFLNGKEIAQSDAKGFYKLERLKAGTYNLQATAEGFLFKDVAVKMNPNSEILDLIPMAYQVCGTVVSDKSQTVTLTHVEQSRVITTASDKASGKFCEYLTPGKYQVQVVADPSQKGLQFFPTVHSLEVESEQSGTIIFSQLKATVSGRIQCINNNDCAGLKVTLKPIDTSEKNDAVISITDNVYQFFDIHPGMYEVSLSNNKLCWRSNKQQINVNSISVEVPPFVQSGYSVVFVSSHDTQLTYQVVGQSKEMTVNINEGRETHCLEKAGSYNFRINSCHSYSTDTVTYNTDSSVNEILLNALKHTSILTIKSEAGRDVNVTALVNIDGVKTETPPLPFNENGYEIKLLLNPSETAVIVPQSDVLYFSPPILSVNGNTDCEDLGVMFNALEGVVFQGKIVPPLSGVLVTVETENSDTLMAETDSQGVYKFPPLDKTKSYKITATKDSYVLVGPNKEGNFIAHKLAEIVIEVVDNSDKRPLQGTLLSLSGDDSYRSNLQTNENGKITFSSLSPGKYFLRPMMKEYSFEPNSKIIKVNEGQSVTVQLIGKRVAYSAYGYVTSLNKEPEENIAVVALGVGNCSLYSEESTSESTGQFRIRGLQPYCSYDISVKNNPNSKYTIERSVPKQIHVNQITNDIQGLQLVIFRPVTHVDLFVKVYAKKPEHYKILRLKVTCETSSSTVYTGRIDSSTAVSQDYNYGVLIQIPPLQLDGKSYSVQLESTLSSRYRPEPVLFIANSSFKYVELDFVVKHAVPEQDIQQTSLWKLILIFCVMIAAYNFKKVSQFLKDRLGGYVAEFVSSANKKVTVNDYPVDNDDIDQLVQSINSVKRKPKPKKI